VAQTNQMITCLVQTDLYATALIHQLCRLDICHSLSLSLSVCFNGHFSGGPRLAGTRISPLSFYWS